MKQISQSHLNYRGSERALRHPFASLYDLHLFICGFKVTRSDFKNDLFWEMRITILKAIFLRLCVTPERLKCFLKVVVAMGLSEPRSVHRTASPAPRRAMTE